MTKLILLLLLLSSSRASFSTDFTNFLRSTYGEKVYSDLDRRDLGPSGSFGGRVGPRKSPGKTPVVFVHGVTLKASVFEAHRKFFLDKGYDSGELFATTYGDGGMTVMANVAMECGYVKNVRRLIEAVHNYTGAAKVDVIAFSMGAAISRKALLGGRCVDTSEDLGSHLTDIVRSSSSFYAFTKIDTYVAVGGVVHGLEGCPEWMKMCNQKNGMICSSQYLRDVNQPLTGYEGSVRYALYSSDDTIVGQQCCGEICSQLENATQNFKVEGFGHMGLLLFTIDAQYKMLNQHKLQ